MGVVIFAILTAFILALVAFLGYTLAVWTYNWRKNEKFMAEIEANRDAFTKTPRAPKKPR